MIVKTTIGISPDAKRKLIAIATFETKQEGSLVKPFKLVERWADKEYKKLKREGKIVEEGQE